MSYSFHTDKYRDKYMWLVDPAIFEWEYP